MLWIGLFAFCWCLVFGFVVGALYLVVVCGMLCFGNLWLLVLDLDVVLL